MSSNTRKFFHPSSDIYRSRMARGIFCSDVQHVPRSLRIRVWRLSRSEEKRSLLTEETELSLFLSRRSFHFSLSFRFQKNPVKGRIRALRAISENEISARFYGGPEVDFSPWEAHLSFVIYLLSNFWRSYPRKTRSRQHYARTNTPPFSALILKVWNTISPFVGIKRI